MNILEKFNNDKNYSLIASILRKEFVYDIPANIELVNIVKEYASNWISLGKFDKYEMYYPSLLDYYNKLFVQTFRSLIIERLTKQDFGFNPFQDTINGKTMEDYEVDDYRNMFVQGEREYNPILNRSNKIQYYKQQIHHRHYDATDIGGLQLLGNDEEGIAYKRNTFKQKK